MKSSPAMTRRPGRRMTWIAAALVCGAIVGEYLGGSDGLGSMVVSAMNSLDAARTFALILMLSFIGLALFLVVNELKRFFIPWHESVYGLQNRDVQ